MKKSDAIEKALKATLINVLSRHQGRDNGISARYLALYIGVGRRRLRTLISLARYEDGIAICGHPTTGYYIAQTADELELCTNFLRNRAVHSLQLLARMTKTSMPELIGQLKLNQA